MNTGQAWLVAWMFCGCLAIWLRMAIGKWRDTYDDPLGCLCLLVGPVALVVAVVVTIAEWRAK